MKKQQQLAERLVLLREEYGITPEKMGAILNKSRVAVDNIEKGVTAKPQETTINLIAEKFGTTKEWLLLGEGEMLPEGKLKLEQTGISTPGNPWREEAYQVLKQELQDWKQKHSEAMQTVSMLIQRIPMGKFDAFNQQAA